MQFSTIRLLGIAATVSLLALGCPPSDDGEDGGGGSDTGSPADTGEVMDGDSEDSGADTAPDTSDEKETGTDTASDTQGDTPDGDSSLTARSTTEQFTSLIAEGYCAAAFNCPQKTSRIRSRVTQAPDESGCRDRLKSAFLDNSTLDRVESDIENGLTNFNEQKARECLQALQDRVNQGGCRNTRLLLRQPTVCDEVFEGTQAKGDPCTSSRQCMTGRCDRAANSNECYGACEDAPTQVGGGEVCDGFDTRCNRDKKLVCVRRDPTDQSTERVCKSFASKGMGETCGSPFRCDDGLNCINNTCQALTIKAQGESCDGTTEACEVGMVCKKSVSGSGGNETVSTSCETAGTAGDDCYSDSECQPGLYCAGATFAPSMSEDSVVGSCTALKPNGESCNSADECESRNCESGTCEKQKWFDCEIPSSG